MSYPCTGCGCCCRKIREAVAEVSTLEFDADLSFPYSWDEKGVCEKLGADNKCTIYDTRPLICRVDEMQKIVEEQLGIGKEECYLLTKKSCNALMDFFGIDESFKIPI